MEQPTINSGAAQEPQEDPSRTRYFPPEQVSAPPPTGGGYAPPSANYGSTGTEYAPNTPQGNGQAASPQQYNPAPLYAPNAAPRGGYQPHRKDRDMWGLILVIGGLLLLANQIFAMIGFGSLVLLVVGGAFLFAYFNTRPGYRIGYLIPGSILAGLGIGTLIDDFNFLHLFGGSFTVLTLGLGFCFIWLMERKHWWALIPGSILVLVGLTSVLAVGRLWPLFLIGLGLYMLYDHRRRQVR